MSPLLLVALFFATVIAALCAFEGGLRFGRWRSQQPDPEPSLPVRTLVASIMSLLAFILGFTFGSASSHFDSRSQSVFDEAVAIGTAYHRADFLPDPEAANMRRLLREVRRPSPRDKSIRRQRRRSRQTETVPAKTLGAGGCRRKERHRSAIGRASAPVADGGHRRPGGARAGRRADAHPVQRMGDSLRDHGCVCRGSRLPRGSCRRPQVSGGSRICPRVCSRDRDDRGGGRSWISTVADQSPGIDGSTRQADGSLTAALLCGRNRICNESTP